MQGKVISFPVIECRAIELSYDRIPVVEQGYSSRDAVKVVGVEHGLELYGPEEDQGEGVGLLDACEGPIGH